MPSQARAPEAETLHSGVGGTGMTGIVHAPTDTRAQYPEHIVATGEGLREALRAVPSPIVVVTLQTESEPRGATIGSFASVSLDPPLVSFNVTRGTRLHDALVETRQLAIHFLAADQADIATRFAIPDLDGADQFGPFAHQLVDGQPPLLDGVLHSLMCVTESAIEAGDHLVVIASVESIRPGRVTDPLLYFDRSYRGIGAPVDG